MLKLFTIKLMLLNAPSLLDQSQVVLRFRELTFLDQLCTQTEIHRQKTFCLSSNSFRHIPLRCPPCDANRPHRVRAIAGSYRQYSPGHPAQNESRVPLEIDDTANSTHWLFTRGVLLRYCLVTFI